MTTMKNADGTPYQLQSPSVLSKTQEWWDYNQIILHNFEQEISTNTVVDANILPPIPPPLPNPVQIKIEQPKENKETQIISTFCLLSKIKESVDPLYGEITRTQEYGEVIKIQIIFVNKTDLAIVFLANTKITEGSIIYPSKFINGKKLNDFNWWKVVSVNHEENKYVYEAIISDFHPYFEEDD